MKQAKKFLEWALYGMIGLIALPLIPVALIACFAVAVGSLVCVTVAAFHHPDGWAGVTAEIDAANAKRKAAKKDYT